MLDHSRREHVAHLIDPHATEVLSLMGPTVELLTRPEADDLAPCVMRGTIPPCALVPLHGHMDPETFFVLSGEFEGLVESDGGYTWVPIGAGDLFHVPGGARHAFRNRSSQPAVMMVISTAKMARFFREIGAPVAAGALSSGPPSVEMIRRFLETSDRYGYWNATPEENAKIGLFVPAVS